MATPRAQPLLLWRKRFDRRGLGLRLGLGLGLGLELKGLGLGGAEGRQGGGVAVLGSRWMRALGGLGWMICWPSLRMTLRVPSWLTQDGRLPGELRTAAYMVYLWYVCVSMYSCCIGASSFYSITCVLCSLDLGLGFTSTCIPGTRTKD